MHSNQSGFRPVHSTRNFEGELTGIAFIDLQKAFDTINHEMLLLLNEYFEVAR